jgi:hypothetical protein
MLIALFIGYLARTGKLNTIKGFFRDKVIAKVYIRNTIA